MKKNYAVFLLLLAAICGSNNFSFGQSEEKYCGSDAALRKLYEQYPELIKEHEQFLENNKRIIKENEGRGVESYVIPIVFHIIHQNGTENISDAQVLDEVNILNRDYNAVNPDTSAVIPVFKPLIGNAHIEFRLASKDKSGFCTNGIEHIYSHETNIGDDFSKLNQWPRSKYLNVWVVKTMAPGVAGYAYYPSATTGLGFYRDGVIILQDYIGSIGTGSPGRSRALTHEIGHYLGLAHTWGSTNDPGVACGDDAIMDTPETKGWQNCNLNGSVCNPPIIENVQNYMEYAYCSRMFTIGQTDYMDATLNSGTAYRDNLPMIDNLSATGTDVLPAPVCTPLPDFSANRNYICQGGTVAFTNRSQRASVTSYAWSFQGGAPSTSSSASPVVTFNSPGWQSVTLTVSNTVGSETKSVANYIYVSPSSTDFTGPYSEGFEGSSANQWIVENPESNPSKWQAVSYGAYTGTKSVCLNNIVNTTDPFYYGRLGGNKDALISPSYNLSSTTGAILTFKYSCATKASTVADLKETLKVYSSTDCGATWTVRKTLTGTALTNAGFWGDAYVANPSSFWTTSTVSLSALQVANIRFKFEYTSTDYSNNIYLDDINVEGVMSTGEISPDYFALNIFPNPSASGIVNIRYFNRGSNVDISITNIVGEKVFATVDKAEYGDRTIEVNTQSLSLSPGVYFVNIFDSKKMQSAKVAVY